MREFRAGGHGFGFHAFELQEGPDVLGKYFVVFGDEYAHTQVGDDPIFVLQCKRFVRKRKPFPLGVWGTFGIYILKNPVSRYFYLAGFPCFSEREDGMAAISKSASFTVMIALSGLFASSAYVPALGIFTSVLAPLVWATAAAFALAGAFTLAMSKATAPGSVPALLAKAARPKTDAAEPARHDPLYALGMVMAIMLAISVAMTGRYVLAVCYVAAFAAFRYGMGSLKRRADWFVSMAKSASG